MRMLGIGRIPSAAEEYARDRLPRLLAQAHTLTMNRADAEDLVQETLLKVMLNWERVSRTDTPDAYVRQILVNTFLSGKRKRSATEITSDKLEPSAGSAAEEALSPLFGDVWPHVAKLPPKQRAALALRYYEDLPDERIAELLHCSTATVRSNVHRALATLRAAVSSVG